MTTRNERPSPPGNQEARLLIRVMLRLGESTYTLGDAEISSENTDMAALLAHIPLPPVECQHPPETSPAELHQRLATLCQRLGVDEPVYEQLGGEEATALITRLQAEEDDLLRTAVEGQAPGPSTAVSSAPGIDKALLRQLKERWRTHFCPQGSVDNQIRDWEDFKTRVCGTAVPDRSMQASQYEQLLAALALPVRERKG